MYVLSVFKQIHNLLFLHIPENFYLQVAFFFLAGHCFLVCNHIGVNILWLIDILFQTRYILSLFRKLVGFLCTCVGPIVCRLFTFLLFLFLLQMSLVTSKSADLKFISKHDTDRDSPATQ